MSVINSYVNNLDDAITQKLEVILGSFTRQIHLDKSRKMTSTYLNEYFT